MRTARVWSRVHLVLALALLAASAWLGISEGLIATHTGVTAGQHVATATQLCYGVFGLLALTSLISQLNRPFRIAASAKPSGTHQTGLCVNLASAMK